MASRQFRSIRSGKKPRKPTAAQIQRAARAILFPEAGDPLPPPGSLLEQEAQKFVAFIARRQEQKQISKTEIRQAKMNTGGSREFMNSSTKGGRHARPN